jgi:murein L,D-transpeptidase YcbB/YkuD
MSSIPRSSRSGRFVAFAAIALISILTFCRTGAGQTSNSLDRPPVTPDTVPAESERGSSTLWRSYIWQSLPAENLNGPDNDPVSQAYQEGDWKPIFINSRFRLNHVAAHLISRLRTMENDALDPRLFKLDELSQSLENLDRQRSALSAADPEINDRRAEFYFDSQPPATAGNQSTEPAPPKANSDVIAKRYREIFQAASETDTRLTAAFFLFAREMNPYLPCREASKVLSGEVPASEFFKELEPKTFNYEALRSAYAKYKNLAARGTQQRVTMPAKVCRGESGNDIRDLQKRLQEEDFYRGNITGVYDVDTERAVKEFQASHLLDPDGSVGRATKEWLNVSFQEKADLIAYAMKAERQSPSRSNSRFIRINIPQFVLQYYKDGQLQEAHRIVVGKEAGKKVKFRGRMVGENQTPTLSSTIQQIILNPRWYVSDRIRLELESQAGSDPEWFKKHGYVSMSSPSGAQRLFQSPGPKNALGRVKFEFPNPYAVYLHDTPLKHLFARSRRDFSHGCIRVDKAIDLAQTLLKDDASPSANKMESILEGSRQVFVSLTHPVPISLEYIPVVAGNSGQVIFAGDLYGIFKEDGLRAKPDHGPDMQTMLPDLT